MKTCSKCKISKDLDCFFKRSEGRYRRDCKECIAKYNRERYKKDRTRIKKQKDALKILPKHKERRRLLYREKSIERYGISIEDFQLLLDKQNNCCKICKTKFSYRGSGKGSNQTSPHIDHDHTCCETNCSCCGKCIRGLLCGICNKALGLFHDNIQRVKAALNYLEDYENKETSDSNFGTNARQSCIAVDTEPRVEL